MLLWVFCLIGGLGFWLVFLFLVGLLCGRWGLSFFCMYVCVV
jgi:hypothetical protein